MTRGYRFFAGLAAVAVTAALASPASAQVDQKTGKNTVDVKATDVAPSEIIVTASRRGERLGNVASSITALGSAQLENLVASRFDDFVSQIPNISFAGNGRGNRLVILRGISTSSNDQNATVATYIDDVPVGSSTSLAVGARFKPDVDAFDLDRLEVLRGPQGTLYGANSLGGLIKYVTKPPRTDKYEFYGRGEVNTVAHGGEGYGVNLGANIPLGKALALRVSGFHSKEAGFIDNVGGKNDVNDLKTSGARATLLAKVSDALTLKASAMYQRYRTGAESTVNITNISTGELAFGPYQQQRFTPEPQTLKFQLYALSANWDLGFGNLTSTTSYSITDVYRTRDYTQPYTNPIRVPGVFLYSNGLGVKTDKFTQEIKLASPSNKKLEWILGGIYTNEKSRAKTLIVGLTAPGVVGTGAAANVFSDDSKSKYEQYAAFGDVTVYLGEKFDITGGLRYSEDKVELVTIGGGLLNGAGSVSAPPATKKGTWTFLVTPRLHISDDTMIYGRAAKGFRPGGPNIVTAAAIAAGAGQSFAPDSLINYEVGLKTSVLDRRLSFDLSLFYINWKDIQIRTSSGGFFFIGNAGTAVSKGGELSINARPTAGLSLNVNVGYTDARLASDALGIGGRNGDILPNVPKWTLGGAVDYSFPLAEKLEGSLGLSFRVIDDRLADFNRNFAPRYSADGYGTLDLRAGLKFEKFNVDLFARNVTDTRGVESATTNFFNFNNLTISRPRTLGVAVTARL
jgi:iron complex outermembrane receptor protein